MPIDPDFFTVKRNPFSEDFRNALSEMSGILYQMYADYPAMRSAAYEGQEFEDPRGSDEFFYARITDDKPIIPKDQQDTEEENPINQWRYSYEEVSYVEGEWSVVEGGRSYTFPPEGEEEGDIGGWAINGAEAFNDKSGVEGAGINVDDPRYSDCQLELKPINQGVVLMKEMATIVSSGDNLISVLIMYFYAANDHDFEQPG